VAEREGVTIPPEKCQVLVITTTPRISARRFLSWMLSLYSGLQGGGSRSIIDLKTTQIQRNKEYEIRNDLE